MWRCCQAASWGGLDPAHGLEGAGPGKQQRGRAVARTAASASADSRLRGGGATATDQPVLDGFQAQINHRAGSFY